jgi:chemotaxis signal transduction protein
VQLVVFSLGRDRYALPVERVRDVIRHRAPTAGVINLRGSLVPVRDIAERVGAAARAGAAPRIVIVDLHGTAAGVVVDAVESVRDVDDGELASVPPEIDTGLLRCIAWVDGVLVPVLDAERVLADLLPPAAMPRAEAKPAAEPRAEAKPAAEPRGAAKPAAEPPGAAKRRPAKRGAKPAANRRAKPKAKPAAKPKAQPSRKRSEKATRSTGGAETGSPSSVTE